MRPTWLVPVRRAGMQSRRACVVIRDAGASALGYHVARGNQKISYRLLMSMFCLFPPWACS